MIKTFSTFFLLVLITAGSSFGSTGLDHPAWYQQVKDTVESVDQSEKPAQLETGNESAFWIPRWFIFLFLFIIVIILFVAVGKISQFRINILEKRKDKLEELVMDRTSDLLKEKEKVERLLEISEHSKQELKEANEIKSKLIHIAAHDLKNPLQAIIGFEFLLDEEKKLSNDMRESMESIFKSSKKMLNIVSELLITESSDTHTMVLKKEIKNLAEVVDEVVSANKIRASQKNQNVVSKLDRSIYLEIDPVWMIKAIDNILSNAIKYSEYGKTVWINLIKNDSEVSLTIIDEGQGISASDKEKLFKKFSRINSIPTDGESSTGLGLYIAKDIIEKHSGTISVESQLKKGATFTIKLPL